MIPAHSTLHIYIGKIETTISFNKGLVFISPNNVNLALQINLSTQQYYFLYNINVLWDTSFRRPVLTGVIAENPEAVCVMQEGWGHQPLPYLQEKAVLQFLTLSFCKIIK